MRLLVVMLALLATPAAAQQSSANDQPRPLMVIETIDGRSETLYGLETLSESGTVEKRIFVSPETSQNSKLMESLRAQGFNVVVDHQIGCRVDYSDIDAEQKESNERLRAMRGKVIPLQHQYEQELYYRDRREKRYEEKCGKRMRSAPDQRNLDMTLRACKAIEVDCKPVKHW